MSNLRILGVIVSLGILAFSINRRRAGKFRNLDLLIGIALAVALFLASVHPNALNYGLSPFSFQPGSGGRIIGLLVLSNFVIYLLLLQLMGQVSTTERNLSSLVKTLAKSRFREEYQKRKVESNLPPIQVVIPAYNEAESIAGVLQRIPAQVMGLDVGIIVTVDGATDGTEEIVRKLNVPAVVYDINRGGGAALKAGYEIALEQGAKIIVTMDADGQQRPEEIPKLVRPIIENEADLVSGSRVLGSYEKDSLVRAVGIFVFNKLVSLLTLTSVTDCSNSFRAIRASELEKLELRQDHFPASELLIDAVKKGLRVKEVPVTILRRQAGKTKKPFWFTYGWEFAKAIFKTWLR
jgi:cellulose synthase/poly-beta-1,6-N-acetylglucosamine synthase-like glycosyltransferase